MNPAFSTGFPGLDTLIEGVRPGDNIIFHAPTKHFFRPFVTALLAHCQQTPLHVAHVRIDQDLDDMFPALPGISRFDGFSFTKETWPIDNPDDLLEALQTFILQQGKHVNYVSLNLSTLLDILGRESLLRNFYRECCCLLADLQSVAYWFIVKDSLTPETVASIRDTAQVFLDVADTSDSPIIHVGKALGRFSEHMAWPHRLDPDTGQVHPLHEKRPSGIQLLDHSHAKIHELQSLRNDYTRALEEEQIFTALCRLEISQASLSALLEHAVQSISKHLNAPYVFVGNFLPDHESLQISHGIGWKPGVVDSTWSFSLEDCQTWSHASFQTAHILEDRKNDPWFNHFQFLREHHIVSGIRIPLQGPEKRPFGMLGAFSAKSLSFTQDAHFLETIANLLTLAIERQWIDAKRATAQAHLQGIIEISQDAIISIDEAQCVTMFNPAAEHIFGYRAEEIIGHSLDRLLPSYAHESHRSHIQEFGASSDQCRPMHARNPIAGMRKNGDEFPAEATIAKFDIDHQQSYTVRLRDLTEKFHMEDALKKSEIQLRQAQKLEALGTLAGGISHDFNNILTSILGYTDLARMGLPDSHVILPHLKQVLTAGNRAKKLVSQILAFSRKTEPERQIFNLHDLVKETIDLLQPTFPSTIEIHQHIDTRNERLFGDPTQIQQVLMNLCTNAEHAMREQGGILDIRVEAIQIEESDSSFSPTSLKPGSYCMIHIRDTGRGIAPETLDRIFEPFFTTKVVQEGTGLGLSVAHGIVKNHGGDILVQSVPGSGTTFTIYLPQLALESESPLSFKELPGIPSGQERILLVEDEYSLGQLIHALLQPYGYDVVTHTHSLEALTLFRAAPFQFDLVLTDQTMPHMTGDALAQEILRIRPDMPIILCTGYSQTMTEEKVKALGIRALLMKPWSTHTLVHTIRNVLDQCNVQRLE